MPYHRSGPEPQRWTVELDDIDHAAIEAELARVRETMRQIGEAIAPVFETVRAAVDQLAAQHPELLDPPAAAVDPFERAMHARRTRGTGPPPRPLDGRGRR